MSRALTTEEKMLFEHRKQIALAQMDVVIDVLSAWNGRYQDDHHSVTPDWLMRVIPPQKRRPSRGWLECNDSKSEHYNKPAIGWKIYHGGDRRNVPEVPNARLRRVNRPPTRAITSRRYRYYNFRKFVDVIVLRTLDRSIWNRPIELVTRKEFREEAWKNGVSLPAYHATLYQDFREDLSQ